MKDAWQKPFKEGMIRMKYRNSYIYGSAAPQLNEPQQTPERQAKTNRNPVHKKTVVTEIEVEILPVAQMIICILIAFAIFSTIIYRFGTITEMNCVLSALNEEYETLKDDNRKLQVSIGSTINQENIRKIAQERLNMKTPDSYQRIPIEVPKVNYSTLAIVEQEAEQIDFKSILLFLGIE
ncbi:MAG TPA: cell division protein FtsL [Thermoclostridium sp.]|nr:cell division protein FtsL [Thermoclostridium sp.]